MDQQQLLHELRESIARWGLLTPARMLAELARPLDIVGSQAASLLRPLLPTSRWRQYACLFEDPASWQALRALLARQDY
jgi:hypothetical protein